MEQQKKADKWTSYELVVFFYYGNEMVVHPASREKSAIWNSDLFGLDTEGETFSFDKAKQRVREKAKDLIIVVGKELAADLVSRALIGRMKTTDKTFRMKLVDEFTDMASAMRSDAVKIEIATLEEGVKRDTVALVKGLVNKIPDLIDTNDTAESIVGDIVDNLTRAQRVSPRPSPGGVEEEEEIEELREKARKWDSALDICATNLDNLPRFGVSANREQALLVRYRDWVIGYKTNPNSYPPALSSVANTLLEWNSETELVSTHIDRPKPVSIGMGLISNRFPDYT